MEASLEGGARLGGLLVAVTRIAPGVLEWTPYRRGGMGQFLINWNIMTREDLALARGTPD